MGMGQFVISSGVGGWLIDVDGGTAKNTVPRFLILDLQWLASLLYMYG